SPSRSGGDENGDSTIQIDLTSILHSAVSASSQGRLSDTPCVSRWSHGVSWRCRSCRLVHASRCCFVASLGGENHFGSDHHALTTLDWSFLRSFDPSDHHDDDAPIILMDQDDSLVASEFSLSLIGKVLNLKKQNVEKLLQKMPSQWGMEDRITANDLGNGKFLLNFTSEEDLSSVLRQGPFHFNFCMFVLVRWEPIVHDDYPWIVPFKVQVIGLPLHLWTDTNLRNIGARLGHVHVDSLDVAEGSMLIDVDSRKPLKFSRKVESKDGDEVTIEIKYEKLFKHCSTCGMLTHEKDHCPSLDVRSRLQSQPERPGIFTRCRFHRIRHSIITFTLSRGQMYTTVSLMGNVGTCQTRSSSRGMARMTGSMHKGRISLVISVLRSDRIMRRHNDPNRAIDMELLRVRMTTWREKAVPIKRPVSAPMAPAGMLPYEKGSLSFFGCAIRLQNQPERDLKSPDAWVPQELRHSIITFLHNEQKAKCNTEPYSLMGNEKYAQRTHQPGNLRATHSDRIMRRHNDPNRSNRYGASKGPYDRNLKQTWREKAVPIKRPVSAPMAPGQHQPALDRLFLITTYCTSKNGSHGCYVTPSRIDHDMEENVTKRGQRSLLALFLSRALVTTSR
ncbi:hypothetical protein HID58_085077, partial [Brassica napus]